MMATTRAAAGDGGVSLRIAVVGAGIVGCSAALFLQRDGHEVTIFDPRPPGTGTSFGNAGLISLYSISPIVTSATLKRVPAMLRDPHSPLALRWRHLPRLLPWLIAVARNSRPERVERNTVAIASLLARAGQAHDILIQQCGLADLVRPGGWLKVAYDGDLLDRATASDRALYDRMGLRWRIVGREEAKKLEPALSPEVAGGILLEDNRAIRNPQRYVDGIARTVLERGGRHLRARVLGLEREGGGKIVGVRTEAGAEPADAVVIAAGAFSRVLAREVGVRVLLEAERGYHLMLPTPKPSLTRPVYTIEGGFMLAPMEDGIRLTGGVELASNDAPPDYRRIHRLLPRAQRLLPSLGRNVLSEWQGHRPTLPDSLPVIGQAPDHPNVWLAFGHQHIGLTLGPVTGRILADLVGNRDPGIDVTPYRADRRFV